MNLFFAFFKKSFSTTTASLKSYTYSNYGFYEPQLGDKEVIEISLDTKISVIVFWNYAARPFMDAHISDGANETKILSLDAKGPAFIQGKNIRLCVTNKYYPTDLALWIIPDTICPRIGYSVSLNVSNSLILNTSSISESICIFPKFFEETFKGNNITDIEFHFGSFSEDEGSQYEVYASRGSHSFNPHQVCLSLFCSSRTSVPVFFHQKVISSSPLYLYLDTISPFKLDFQPYQPKPIIFYNVSGLYQFGNEIEVQNSHEIIPYHHSCIYLISTILILILTLIFLIMRILSRFYSSKYTDIHSLYSSSSLNSTSGPQITIQLNRYCPDSSHIVLPEKLDQ